MRRSGKRIGAAMSALNPSLSEHVAGLLAIAKNKNARTVEEFFPDVPEGPLKETALAIISAWYLGIVSDAPDAEVFAFEYALMYGPTKDVMTIPSYAISGSERVDGGRSAIGQHAGILKTAAWRERGLPGWQKMTAQMSWWWEPGWSDA